MRKRRPGGPPQVHDINWCELLGHRTALEELLRGYVPEVAGVLAELDFVRATCTRPSFGEVHKRKLHSDVLWKISGKRARDCFVYFLIEHQSGEHKHMALRMFRYIAAVLGEWLDKAHEREKEPPIVIPVVLHCAATPWRAPLTIEETSPTFGRFWGLAVKLRYFLIDVIALRDEQIVRAGNALAGLFLLEKGRFADTGDYTKPAAACFRAEEDRSFLEATLTAAYNIHRARARGPLPAEVRRVLDARDSKEGAMAQTMLEYLTKCGRADEREEDRRRALVSLKKAFSLRGVDFRAYVRDFEGFATASRITRFVVSFLVAKNPRSYLKRRFGH